MRHLKLLVATAIVTAGLAAPAGQAFATYLTSPPGTKVPAGVTIHFKEKNGKWKFTMQSQEVECGKFTIHMDSTNSGSAFGTVHYDVTKVKQEECSGPVTVLSPGTLEYHTLPFSPPGRATVTWSGLELSTEPFSGVVCIYKTSNTDLGTVSGGSPAIYNLSGMIPRTGGSFLCGSSATMTAEYEMTTPSSLAID
jgi:hypothetical protein